MPTRLHFFSLSLLVLAAMALFLVLLWDPTQFHVDDMVGKMNYKRGFASSRVAATTAGAVNEINYNDAASVSPVNYLVWKESSNSSEQEQEQKSGSESVSSNTAQKDKPLLVLHIGPPKTFTTTLQTELTQYTDVLAEQDNYFYGGRSYILVEPAAPPSSDETSSSNRSNATTASPTFERSDTILTKAAKNMFKPSQCPTYQHPEKSCVQDFVDALSTVVHDLEQLHNSKQDQDATAPFVTPNILLSDEGLTMWFATTQHYQVFYDALSPDWQVVILLGYRRFFEWLPSKNFQNYRMDRANTWKESWPLLTNATQQEEKERLVHNSKYASTKARWPELVFPHLAPDHQWRDHPKYKQHTKIVIDTIDNVIPVRVMNVHSQDFDGVVVTKFLCQVLPAAHGSCQVAQQRDDQTKLQLAKEERSGQGDAVGLHMNDHSGVLDVNYDLIALEAAEQGLIDIEQHQRSHVREALGKYVETTLGLSPNSDLPLACPSDKDLQAYLQTSLELEEAVLGTPVAQAMKAEHEAAFQSKVNSQAFCFVDPKAALRDKRFFDYVTQNFGPSSKQSMN